MCICKGCSCKLFLFFMLFEFLSFKRQSQLSLIIRKNTKVSITLKNYLEKKKFLIAQTLFQTFFFFETDFHYITKAGFKLMILLPQLPKYWDYKCALPCLTLFQDFKTYFQNATLQTVQIVNIFSSTSILLIKSLHFIKQINT
jgi:hypothetical protein